MKWVILFSLMMFFIFGCGKDQTEETTDMAKNDQQQNMSTPMPSGPAKIAEGDYKETESGLKYAILKDTDGQKPENGQTVVVHYSGWLPDGKNFDSSYKRNQPFEFVLGARQVIRGWDEGIALLQKGEKAQLVIPPALGYGQRGIPGVIPPNSTLIFDVELIDIK